MSTMVSRAVTLFGMLVTTAACSLAVGSDVDGKGLGEACGSDDDCHAGQCDRAKGVCTAKCAGDVDCPTGTRCFAGACERPLKAAALYVGVAAVDEGWTLSHDAALRAAQSSLPFVEAVDTVDLVAPGAVGPKVDALVAGGAQVVFATSFSHAREIIDASTKYPDVTFLTCSGNVSNGKNLGSYWGRMEQAWYVAGRLAAQQAKSRLGFLGSFVTPEVVRHLNAFTLGARRENPSIVVEVRWLGFWFDWKALDGQKVACKYGKDGKCSREEWHTEKLIESGAEVIAHQVDNGLPVRFIEAYDAHPQKPATAPRVYSIGNDVRHACRKDNKPEGEPYPSCLFSVYWNWQPLYTSLLSDVHYRRWRSGLLSDNVQADTTRSVASIEPNTSLVADTIVKNMLSEVAGPTGVSKAFEGPFETTGQRAPMGAGERPTDAELASMCWAVKGVVEREDANDPASKQRDALVPDATHPAPAGVIGPTNAPDDVAHDCTQNGPPVAP